VQKVRIVTDSVADIPPDVAERYGITVVPAYVMFGLTTYRDGVELSSEEYYNKLMTEKDLPKTSQPSPADFLAAYEEIVRAGDSVISIQPSGALSGTYASACLARASLPHADIDVVDTRQATMAQGLVAVEAARAALLGLSNAEILHMVKGLVDRVKVYVSLDSLDFIVRSGRVGKAKAIIAQVLNIKPIITLTDGVLEPLDRVRGAARVIPRLVEMCASRVQTARCRASVIHARAMNYALKLKEEVDRRLNTCSILASAGPAITTNAGPGSYGVAVMELPDKHPVPVD